MPTLTFNCPRCNQVMQVKDELAGKKVRCPGCQNVVSAPKPNEKKKTPVKRNTQSRPQGAQKKPQPNARGRKAPQGQKKPPVSSRRTHAMKSSKPKAPPKKAPINKKASQRRSAVSTKETKKSSRNPATGRSARVKPQKKKDNTMLYAGLGGGGLIILILILLSLGGEPQQPKKSTPQVHPMKKWLTTKKDCAFAVAKVSQFNDGTVHEFDGRMKRTGKDKGSNKKSHSFTVVNKLKGRWSGFSLYVKAQYTPLKPPPGYGSELNVVKSDVAIGQKFIAIRIGMDEFANNPIYLFKHSAKLEAELEEHLD